MGRRNKSKHRQHPWDPVDTPLSIGETLGTGTGQTEHAVESGGWSGTDDATSTAPSDMSNEEENEEDFEGLRVFTPEDSTEEKDAFQNAAFPTRGEDEPSLTKQEVCKAVKQERDVLRRYDAVSAVTDGPVEDLEGVPLPITEGMPALPKNQKTGGL